jgi:hypothetical protein
MTVILVTKRFDNTIVYNTPDLAEAITYATAAVMYFGVALEVSVSASKQDSERPDNYRRLVVITPEHTDWRLASADTILTTKALACGLWPAIDGPSTLRPKYTTIQVEVPE